MPGIPPSKVFKIYIPFFKKNNKNRIKNVNKTVQKLDKHGHSKYTHRTTYISPNLRKAQVISPEVWT